MLRELGVEFKEHVLNLLAGEQRSPSMLAMNPFGKAPVLKDGDVVLFESMAILNYLGEKYPDKNLVPPSGTLARARYDQWMSFCISELEQPLWRMAKHSFLLPEKLRSPQDIELAKMEFRQVASALDPLLEGEFMVENRFTAADIAMTYTLSWAQRAEQLNDFKNCVRYLENHMRRPAFPRHLYKN
jgi:glutathione S-transferase